MTIVALLPALVMFAGAILYVLPIRNPEVKQLALYAFAAGLLVTLFGLAGHAVRIG